MLANLQQISFWQWVIAILVIVGITGLIVWVRRKRMSVTKVEVTTGIVKTTFEPGKQPDPPPPGHQPEPYSTNFSRNKLFGKNKVNIRREGTNMSDNFLAGENEVEIGAKPGPKPKATKGK